MSGWLYSAGLLINGKIGDKYDQHPEYSVGHDVSIYTYTADKSSFIINDNEIVFQSKIFRCTTISEFDVHGKKYVNAIVSDGRNDIRRYFVESDKLTEKDTMNVEYSVIYHLTDFNSDTKKEIIEYFQPIKLTKPAKT